MTQKASFMEQAYAEAVAAGERGEVPIGAVLVSNGKVVAANGNRTIEHNDPTAHAEILVIREACALAGSQRIAGYDLYVTLEPCAMCAAAISNARIGRLYYGASDAKSGGVEHGARFFTQATCHHTPEIYTGLMETDCGTILQEFFQEKRGP